MEDGVFVALLRVRVAILLELILITMTTGMPMAQDEAEDTPLQSRTKELLRSYSQARTKEAMVTIREQLLAKADTLEAAGDDALASQCLERAGIVGYRLAEYDSALDMWKKSRKLYNQLGNQQMVEYLQSYIDSLP